MCELLCAEISQSFMELASKPSQVVELATDVYSCILKDQVANANS